MQTLKSLEMEGTVRSPVPGSQNTWGEKGMETSLYSCSKYTHLMFAKYLLITHCIQRVPWQMLVGIQNLGEWNNKDSKG